MSADTRFDVMVLAMDGDGTLKRAGHVGARTLSALRRWRDAGRTLLFVTGETWQDLRSFPHLKLFALVVAENGALLFDPASHEERLLASPPSIHLLRALRRSGVHPLKRGRVIISTDFVQEDCAAAVLEREAPGWRIIHNRRQIMLLPHGVTKASGLAHAFRALGFSPSESAGIGDAENDIPLLDYCRVGVAVANAVPQLKQRATS